MTKEEIKQFILWHEEILTERKYPFEIVQELRNSRTKFLAYASKEKN